MKRILLALILVGICTPVSLASYTYVSDTYGPVPDLHGTETLLMTDQGGDNLIYLYDSSTATIEGTSELEQAFGGLWEINLVDSSHLDFSGGELGTIDIFSDATAILSGGLIESIESSQIAWEWDYGVDPPEWVPNPHINLIYSGDLPTVDVSNVLTGLWGNGSAFLIELHDVSGYSPVIENIQFELIPEPATLALFGLGGLLLRRKNS